MNPWILHVQAYAKKHNISYGDAIKKAKATYTKKKQVVKKKKK